MRKQVFVVTTYANKSFSLKTDMSESHIHKTSCADIVIVRKIVLSAIGGWSGSSCGFLTWKLDTHIHTIGEPITHPHTSNLPPH